MRFPKISTTYTHTCLLVHRSTYQGKQKNPMIQRCQALKNAETQREAVPSFQSEALYLFIAT